MYRGQHAIKECSNEESSEFLLSKDDDSIIKHYWSFISIAIRVAGISNEREYFSTLRLSPLNPGAIRNIGTSSPAQIIRVPAIVHGFRASIRLRLTRKLRDCTVCHFQIAPGLVVFSISEFKAVPCSRCNHLCDRRAAISRQRSVTLYFFFLLSFLPPPSFFSFSISATFSLYLLPSSLLLFLRVFSF